MESRENLFFLFTSVCTSVLSYNIKIPVKLKSTGVSTETQRRCVTSQGTHRRLVKSREPVVHTHHPTFRVITPASLLPCLCFFGCHLGPLNSTKTLHMEFKVLLRAEAGGENEAHGQKEENVLFPFVFRLSYTPVCAWRQKALLPRIF